MPELTIVCVKWGTKYGPEYVNILRDMVWRNLAEPHRFICFTDDPTGIEHPYSGIDIEILPKGLPHWANKLYLFSEDAGLEGKVLFFDLDTAITGRLEGVAEYVDGVNSLTMLQDFYGWTKYGSGMMAWDPKGHFPRLIWPEYVDAGMPQPEKGDQQFICDLAERLGHPVDTWQDKLPGVACSYKIHARKWPPSGCKVVCFHGEPTPNQFPSEWIEHVWKIGGAGEAKLVSKRNTEYAVAEGNLRTNLARDLPHMTPAKPHDRTMVIVGGAPSVRHAMPNIRRDMRNGDVWAVNGTHDWLVGRGVTPDYFAMLDSREGNVDFVRKANQKTQYYIASQCAPDVFDELASRSANVTMWHAYEPDLKGIFEEHATDQVPIMMIGGGNTVAMKLLYLGRYLGYRKFSLYGVDSSYHGEKHHAYSQSLNDGEQRISVFAAGRRFICAPWMLVQARDFQDQVRNLVNDDCVVKVHGGGLIPFIAQQLAKGGTENAA